MPRSGGLNGMNVVVNGLMTNYQKIGSGRRVVVCLHGWADSSATFAKYGQKLAKHYTLLIPDLPGFGASAEPPKAWGIDDYANFLVTWLNKIGQKDVYAIIGHSNGGAIAISIVGRGLIKSKKLILIASSGIRDIYQMKRLLLRGGASIAKLPLKILPKRARNRIKRRAYEAIGSDYMLMPELDSSFRRIVAKDMQETATHIDTPTLLIYGSEDDATPVKYGQLFEDAISRSKLEIIDGADHMIHQQMPDKVAAMSEEFLG